MDNLKGIGKFLETYKLSNWKVEPGRLNQEEIENMNRHKYLNWNWLKIFQQSFSKSACVSSHL